MCPNPLSKMPQDASVSPHHICSSSQAPEERTAREKACSPSSVLPPIPHSVQPCRQWVAHLTKHPSFAAPRFQALHALIQIFLDASSKTQTQSVFAEERVCWRMPSTPTTWSLGSRDRSRSRGPGPQAVRICCFALLVGFVPSAWLSQEAGTRTTSSSWLTSSCLLWERKGLYSLSFKLKDPREWLWSGLDHMPPANPCGRKWGWDTVVGPAVFSRISVARSMRSSKTMPAPITSRHGGLGEVEVVL